MISSLRSILLPLQPLPIFRTCREYLDRDVTVAGMVTDTKNGIGKNGKPYGSFTLQDYTDSFRFMVFDKDYIENSKFFIIGYYLLIKGRVQKRQIQGR